MKKRWTMVPTHPEQEQSLQAALKIHPVLCRILVQRGITDYDTAKDFFRPSLAQLHSPWLMKDMDRAVLRILTAFHTNEPIMVFGDYDVDGTTAVACMYRFLKQQHEAVSFYIPHRYREGYGISKAGIDHAKETGVTLIISLDCGIKSVELIAYAKTLGIDFIVCDHHLPDLLLPDAVAILNPKQADCPYPFKELCGCGVGFKLICALSERLELPIDSTYVYLDLLATAIAADIVPMVGENRILAFHGLIRANQQPNAGIKALVRLSGLTQPLHISNLVFMIAPRVNAAGRMDDARKAVELFITDSEEEALLLAEQLHQDNSDRKEADRSMTEEALALISGNPGWLERKSTVLYQPHWHKGVVGIVASRVIEHHYRPTIILTRSGEYAAGSARSVPGFNLYEAIHACREYLIGYGGHFAAAGMTLAIDQVDAFREKFESVVAQHIEADQLVPEIRIDADITLKDIRRSFFDIVAQMEPFGPDNLRPVFITRNVTDTGWSKMVKEEHIRFSVKQDDTVISGIGFGLAHKFALLEQKQPLDIVYTMDHNEWNGSSSLQLRVIDFALSVADK